jgi:hypothetical protein
MLGLFSKDDAPAPARGFRQAHACRAARLWARFDEISGQEYAEKWRADFDEAATVRDERRNNQRVPYDRPPQSRCS